MENNILDYQKEDIIQEIIPVSKETRFANYLIDTVIGYIFTFSLFFVLALQSPEAVNSLAENSIVDRLLTLITLAIAMVLQEVIFGGRSIGKFVTGTKVIDSFGNKPSIGTLIGRNLCRAIPFNALSFLGNRGWHDSISDTYVVKA